MPRQQSNDFVKLMIVAVLCLVVGYAWGGAAASAKTRVKSAATPCPVVLDPNRPLPQIPVWDQHEPDASTWKVFRQEHPATEPMK